MEYKEFAKYYDRFYKNKDYEKEVGFLMNFIKEGKETSKNLQFVICN